MFVRGLRVGVYGRDVGVVQGGSEFEEGRPRENLACVGKKRKSVIDQKTRTRMRWKRGVWILASERDEQRRLVSFGIRPRSRRE